MSDTSETKEDQKKSLWKRIALLILHQWLLIGMGIACLLAYLFPSFASNGGTIRAEYTILYGAVTIIFLVSGMSIPRDKLITHMHNWRLHLIVQGFSYLFVPALVVGLVQLIHATDANGQIDKSILAGYIFLACLPTTISSNVVMTRAAGGDEAATIVEVLVGNILGPFITPGWTVTLLPKSEVFDPWREATGSLTAMYKDVFQALGLTVLLPLIVGQIIRWTFPDKTAWVMKTFYLAKVSSFCLVLLVWCAFSTCFSTSALSDLSTPSILLTVFLNIGIYIFLTIICFAICRPPTPKSLKHKKYTPRPIPPGETIAICFCGPAKTTGLGIPLLYAMYRSTAPDDMLRNAKTSVAVILYTTEQIFCAHFMVQLFRRWKRKVELSGPVAESDDIRSTEAEMAERTDVVENNSRI